MKANTDLKNKISFINEVILLKEQTRQGWIRYKIQNPESVADHSFGLCLLVLTFCDLLPNLDIKKCLVLALIHDLAEVRVGDITPHDNISKSEKYCLEKLAFEYFSHLLEDQTFYDLWIEYESCVTLEAQFVRDLDILESVFQAKRYENYDVDLEEFWVYAKRAIKTKIGFEIYSLLKSSRRKNNSFAI
ncbi:MAG: HD domain-containing protein [Bacteroidota bacterium]